MTGLVEFLNARLDEDEPEALKHPDGEDSDLERWEILATGEMHYPCSPYLRIAKARVLAEVTAKREIVRRHDSVAAHYRPGVACQKCWPLSCDLYLLALPYADHPDYDPGWRP